MSEYVLLFFFCKQKTAYEMRISDWSSDVCSSDLQARAEAFDALRLRAGQAVELLAQLAAAVALLLAQRRLQREPGLAQQKNDQQDDRRTNGDQQEQQQLGIGHAASVSVPVAANATLRQPGGRYVRARPSPRSEEHTS